jgi:hypothetical protein
MKWEHDELYLILFIIIYSNVHLCLEIVGIKVKLNKYVKVEFPQIELFQEIESRRNKKIKF